MKISAKYSNLMKKIWSFGLCGILLAGTPEEALAIQRVQGEVVGKEKIENMTLEEKIAQMFFITPEALTGVDQVTGAGELTESAFKNYPVGGIIYFRQNLESREQVIMMLSEMERISEVTTGLPVFLATDEEGGQVSRLYGGGITDIPYVGAMYSVGRSGDAQAAYQIGKTIGSYMEELNFNVDFAPVADIFSNPENTVIGDRAFGSDAELVAEMVPMAVKGLQSEGVLATLKHFPGHGDTAEDSHSGYARSYKSLDELDNCEFLPFRAGIEANASFVMMSHISLPNVLDDQTPASLSHEIVTDILRKKLRFSGIIITDALNMGAIAQNYSSGEAAVMAVEAGVDMLLMPADFQTAYEGLINAVYEGRVSEERIDESVLRILQVKRKMREMSSKNDEEKLQSGQEE